MSALPRRSACQRPGYRLEEADYCVRGEQGYNDDDALVGLPEARIQVGGC